MRKALAVMLVLALGVALTVPFIGFGDQEKITITVQDCLTPDQGIAKFLDQVVIPEFEKLHPTVEIKHVFVPFDSALQKILQESLGGTLPEIVMADNPWVPQLIDAGVYKDITDAVMRDLGKNFWLDFFKGQRLLTSKDGRIYALQIHTNNTVLFYRRSLLEKAGVEKVPETWDELMAACEKIKTKLGTYGFAVSARAGEGGTWQFEPFLWTNGGSLLELDQPAAVEALNFLVDLVKKGYMSRDVINAGQGDLSIWFINGEVPMMVNGNWEFGWHLTPDVMSKLGDVGVAPLPVPKEGLKPIVPFGGECYGISSTIDPKKFEPAWEFLKFLYSDKIGEYYEKWAGDIPCRVSYASIISKQRPLLRPFLEQAEYALPRPLLGGGDKYPDVSMVTITAVQKALTGVQTPQQAFEEAAQKIRKLFTSEEYEKYKDMAREILTETIEAE